MWIVVGGGGPESCKARNEGLSATESPGVATSQRSCWGPATPQSHCSEQDCLLGEPETTEGIMQNPTIAVSRLQGLGERGAVNQLCAHKGLWDGDPSRTWVSKCGEKESERDKDMRKIRERKWKASGKKLRYKDLHWSDWKTDQHVVNIRRKLVPSGLAPWTFPRPGLGQRLPQGCGYMHVCMRVHMHVCMRVAADSPTWNQGGRWRRGCTHGGRTASYLCLDSLCRDIIYLVRTWWKSDTVYFKHTFICFLI